ncbi:MAG: trypsin-like peptidase domain-containing protein [Planctomycetota bacterium]|nr:trypsin-like peptidase domain-containing protein [Planctomycetota bacterium]
MSHTHRLALGTALGCAALFCFPAAHAMAQEAPPPSEHVPYAWDSGAVSNDGSRPEVVISETVYLGGAQWMRLHFDRLELSGDVFSGRGSILRLTAHADGAIQELNAIHCEQWGDRSCYFNGDAVQVEVLAWPGTGPNHLAFGHIEVGLLPGTYPSQCGPTDDRVLSADPRAARLLPVGCTGWIIDDCNHCMLTAGHCIAGSVNTAQFNVPLSNGSGGINHPPPEDQYAVDPASEQGVGAGVGNDYGYFGVFPNPITGLLPHQAQGDYYVLSLPPSFDPSQQIRITGYGTDSSPSTHNQVQQTHFGPRLSAGGSEMEYQTDTTGGNSGSPVIWEQTGFAVGIHTHGGCSTNSGNHGTGTNNSGLQAVLAAPQGVCASGLSVIGELPGNLTPGQATSINLEVTGSVVPGSANLHVRYNGGVFLEIPMPEQGTGLYRAVLPPPVCGATPEFYFSVDNVACGTVTLPANAPIETFTASVGTATTVFADDLEADSGWSGGVAGDTATTGQWTRVNPIGTDAQPEDDHTPAPGTICWVTGQGSNGGSVGENDVDGGFTTLESPILDLSAATDPLVSYWRWYSNTEGGSPNADVLVIDVSADGGASWTNVETIGPSGAGTNGGWIAHQFRLLDLVAPTAQVRLRVIASDLGSGSIVEAALDDLEVFDVACTVVLPDCNGNGIVDSDDIASGRSLDGDADGVPDECDGDCNDNGIPDDRDIANGTSADCNLDGMPDECQLSAASYCFCASGAPCSNPDPNAGCAGSTGTGALLSACGTDGVAADDLVLTVLGVPPNQNGLIYMGGGTASVPFGDGLRCVGPGASGFMRFNVQNSGALGELVEGPGIVAFSATHFPPSGRIVAGSTWQFQAWFRDPAGPCGSGFNLSNGLSVTFSP